MYWANCIKRCCVKVFKSSLNHSLSSSCLEIKGVWLVYASYWNQGRKYSIWTYTVMTPFIVTLLPNNCMKMLNSDFLYSFRETVSVTLELVVLGGFRRRRWKTLWCSILCGGAAWLQWTFHTACLKWASGKRISRVIKYYYYEKDSSQVSLVRSHMFTLILIKNFVLTVKLKSLDQSCLTQLAHENGGWTFFTLGLVGISELSPGWFWNPIEFRK